MIALFVAGLLLGGCEKKPSGSQLLNEQRELALAGYCSDDIQIAEQSLMAYREWLDDAERRGVKGIRFDAARGMVDLRLFSIYMHQGSPKADELYPELVEHLNRERVYGGRTPTNITRENLVQNIEVLDRKLDVKWKRSVAK